LQSSSKCQPEGAEGHEHHEGERVAEDELADTTDQEEDATEEEVDPAANMLARSYNKGLGVCEI
jgi:hypothetical protein